MPDTPSPKPRRLLLLRGAAVAVALFVALFAVVWAAACETIGGRAIGAREERIRHSPQWKASTPTKGAFVNPLPRVDGAGTDMFTSWIFGGSPDASPKAAIPVEPRTRADYDAPPATGLRITWLGHSTLFLEVDGQRILIDPVFGERASPFSWIGPKRWFAPPLPLDQLPPIDVVVISHDHYDHLDLPTVRVLAKSDSITWAVPLGVGADLESWGIPSARIAELDWWEETKVGPLTLTATPARHFSGRWLDDSAQTLWAGWAIVGPAHKVFYSGDTALHPTLKDIGDRLGPFDLTMIEVGAYDALWSDVHLGPEQAVLAHQLVRGDVMLPVHWGLFDLALHAWTEPMERTLVAAERSRVHVVAPRPGALVEPSTATHTPERWWPATPWHTVEQAPAWSTHVEALLRGAPGYAP